MMGAPNETKYTTLGPIFCHHGYVFVSISIIREDLETSRRDLAFGSVKTRLKRSRKSQLWGLDSLVGICYGRFKTKISLDICSKEVLTMRNRFFILPKPQKLNYNEFSFFSTNRVTTNKKNTQIVKINFDRCYPM